MMWTLLMYFLSCADKIIAGFSCFQCFDAVSWVVWRASGLWKL